MPIYEYKCQKCGTKIEKLQKMSEKPLTKCQECGGKLEKQWSNTSFQLKGSGWYVTDYAKKSQGGSSKSESKSDSDGKGDSGKDSGSKEKDSGTKKETKSKAESVSKGSEKK